VDLRGGKRGLAAVVLAIVCFAALVPSGCGDSSEAAPLKKSAFVQQANVICVDATQERNEASKELTENEGDGGSAEAAEAAEALVSPVESMAGEISDLGAPKGDEKEIEEIVAAFEAAAAKVEKDPLAPESTSAFAEANEMATAYGLTDCSV
jgi:hypothetical protein